MKCYNILVDLHEHCQTDCGEEEMAKGKGRNPSDTDQEILTLEQAAKFLQISRASMFKLLKDPKSGIPGSKIFDRWRFSRRALLEWLEKGGYGPEK
jgi:predicted DNA-binding transcriptional regulator AlpA